MNVRVSEQGLFSSPKAAGRNEGKIAAITAADAQAVVGELDKLRRKTEIAAQFNDTNKIGYKVLTTCQNEVKAQLAGAEAALSSENATEGPQQDSHASGPSFK
ncbi:MULTISPECIES: hypothetical protein [unclassified Legionella]|uniref:hypothetical protein n=1 Tax=unclassified Legionella TaxID=2622702 RepID=UPI001056AACE|nr:MULTISPECIES: hypothetical protein [unclassified Legionella]MDI9817877.1 hypothetical protein [Legionella sp. PL877]